MTPGRRAHLDALARRTPGAAAARARGVRARRPRSGRRPPASTSCATRIVSSTTSPSPERERAAALAERRAQIAQRVEQECDPVRRAEALEDARRRRRRAARPARRCRHGLGEGRLVVHAEVAREEDDRDAHLVRGGSRERPSGLLAYLLEPFQLLRGRALEGPPQQRCGDAHEQRLRLQRPVERDLRPVSARLEQQRRARSRPPSSRRGSRAAAAAPVPSPRRRERSRRPRQLSTSWMREPTAKRPVRDLPELPERRTPAWMRLEIGHDRPDVARRPVDQHALS